MAGASFHLAGVLTARSGRLFALVLAAFALTAPVHAAAAPSWRIAGTAATPIRVPVVQRLVDRGPDGRAAALELDAIVPVDGKVPWGSALPVLEGKGRGKREWTRIRGACATRWLDANGDAWSHATGDTIRSMRLRFRFDGDSIATVGRDGPWRLRFVTVAEDPLDRSAWRHFEAFTAPLRAMEFGTAWVYLRDLQVSVSTDSSVRVVVVIEATRPDTCRLDLSAWEAGLGPQWGDDQPDIDEIDALERAARLDQMGPIARPGTPTAPTRCEWGPTPPPAPIMYALVAGRSLASLLRRGSNRLTFDLPVSNRAQLERLVYEVSEAPGRRVVGQSVQSRH